MSGGLDNVKVSPWPGNPGGASVGPAGAVPERPKAPGKGKGGAPPVSAAPPAADTAAPASETPPADTTSSAEPAAGEDAPPEPAPTDG